MKIISIQIILLVFCFQSSNLLFAQYNTPSHSKGVCYKLGTTEHLGKATLSEVHIFNEYTTTFFKNEIQSSCLDTNTSGGHYQLNSSDTDFYLTANFNYTIRVMATNPDATNDLVACAVWLDLNGDSAFSTSELISPAAWKVKPDEFAEFSFVVPNSINTENARMRIRTEKGSNISTPSDFTGTLEYGQTLDVTYRQFNKTQYEANFWVLDTAFVGSPVFFSNANEIIDSVGYIWTVDGARYTNIHEVVQIFASPGAYEIKLVSFDSTTNQKDSIVKNLVVVSANEVPIPRFNIQPKTISLNGSVDINSISQNYEYYNKYRISQDSIVYYSESNFPNSFPFWQRTIGGNLTGGAWQVCMKSANLLDTSDWYCEDRALYVGIDTFAPVITIIGMSNTTINVYTSYTDQGASAYDDSMGVINHRITTSGTVDTSTIGDYTITYTVSDTAGNTTTETRIVRVRDLEMPELTYLGTDTLYLEQDSVFTSPGASVADNYDINLDSLIQHITNIDITVAGVYWEKFWVTDSSGNTSDTLHITLYVLSDMMPPVLTLIGASDTTIEVYSMWTDPGVIAIDIKYGDISDSVSVSGGVNVNILEDYVITYNVRDSYGKPSSITRTVHVVDTEIPVISSNNDSLIRILVNTSYDPKDHIKLTDNYDHPDSLQKNLTIIYNDVDVTTLGLYSTVFQVADRSGNVSNNFTLYTSVQQSLGINELVNDEAFLLYPNPSSGNVHIKSTNQKPITEITLVNSLGQKIYNESFNSPEVQLDLNSLTSGMYLVKINSDGVRINKKLIVK